MLPFPGARSGAEVGSPAHGRGRGGAPHLGFVVFAGVDFTEVSVLLWRRKVLDRVEVKLRFKII